jgi:aryl-alcohol dehydrogenase-like predicted oxidoreductase
MEYRYLGTSGVKVSELCLGAMTFGREGEAGEQDSHRMLDAFVAAGGNFIDTANVYSRGVSEEIVGRWLKRRDRDELVIASKVRFPMGEGPNDAGLSRKHILASLEASLARLQTDYLDLLQIHAWDPGTPLEIVMSTLDTLVEDGRVRYLGASNLTGYQLQRAIDLSRERGLERFVSLQPQYNLLCRSTEWELIPVALREGLGVIPWSPLRGGWLSGKYQRGMERPPQGTRVEIAAQKGWGESWPNLANEHTWSVIDALLEVSEEAGRTPAQVAVRWLLQRPGVTAPILGARTMAQLEDNLGAVGWSLSEAQMAKLTSASDVTLPYPYDFLEGASRGR